MFQSLVELFSVLFNNSGRLDWSSSFACSCNFRLIREVLAKTAIFTLSNAPINVKPQRGKGGGSRATNGVLIVRSVPRVGI